MCVAQREPNFDVLLDVMTAGGDTTASTLGTAALLLQRHSAAAAEVASEARRAFGDGGGAPSAAELAAAAGSPQALAYTRAVLMETSRLFPAAPLLLRVARADTSLGGVAIPAGSGLVASTAQLGRDSAWGAGAAAFVPERFLPAADAFRSADAARAYMAFGAGPRSCVGQQLALCVASLVLATWVRAADADGLLGAAD